MPTLPGVSFAPRWRGVPFSVIEWQIAPHTRFPPHDHPHYSVCTVCIDGECEVAHFEVTHDGEHVRETRRALLVAGRIDTLSTACDNIHTFTTGERGVRGLDITTLHGRDVGFPWIDLDGPSRDKGTLQPIRLLLPRITDYSRSCDCCSRG
jgi:hypothetical protein